MKKGLLTTMALFLIFIMLIFTSPFMENKTASTLWFLFFIAAAVLVTIWVLKTLNKTSKKKLKEKYKEQPMTQILTIACIISLIYDFINIRSGIYISAFVIGISIIIEFCMWFFKKEEL